MSYPASTAAEVRRLKEAGWGLADIQRILWKEHGITPDRMTLRRWADPEFAERRRERQRKKAWKAHHDRILELRAIGLSYQSISLLLTHDLGLRVSEGQIRRIVDGGLRQNTLARVLSPEAA